MASSLGEADCAHLLLRGKSVETALLYQVDRPGVRRVFVRRADLSDLNVEPREYALLRISWDGTPTVATMDPRSRRLEGLLGFILQERKAPCD